MITRKQAGESFGEGLAPLHGAPGMKVYQAKAEQFAIAGFETGEYLAFVVSDHSERENLQLAANLASPVQQVLDGGRG